MQYNHCCPAKDEGSYMYWCSTITAAQLKMKGVTCTYVVQPWLPGLVSVSHPHPPLPLQPPSTLLTVSGRLKQICWWVLYLRYFPPSTLLTVSGRLTKSADECMLYLRYLPIKDVILFIFSVGACSEADSKTKRKPKRWYSWKCLLLLEAAEVRCIEQ